MSDGLGLLAGLLQGVAAVGVRVVVGVVLLGVGQVVFVDWKAVDGDHSLQGVFLADPSIQASVEWALGVNNIWKRGRDTQGIEGLQTELWCRQGTTKRQGYMMRMTALVTIIN